MKLKSIIKISFIFGVCGFFVPAAVHAQIFRGIVLLPYGNEPAADVLIRNLRTEDTVRSADNGFFSIDATDNDTLTVWKNGYLTERLRVNVLELGNIRRFHLRKDEADTMEEIVVLPNEDTVAFWRRNEKVRNHPFLDTAVRPDNGKGFGVVINGPITSLAGTFSKKQKRRKELEKELMTTQELARVAAVQRAIDKVYTRKLAMQVTGLDASHVSEFMQAYPMSYEFATVGSQLEIMMWIKDNYKKWGTGKK